MRFVFAAIIVASLAACGGVDPGSRVLDTGDSYGPAGRVGINGGAGTVRQMVTQHSPMTSN